MPMCYSAPESELGTGQEKGFGTDIWALLGAIICEVRQGNLPFDEGSITEWLQCLEDILGPLPEPYRPVWIEREVPSSNKMSQVPSDPVSMTAKRLAKVHEDRLREKGYATRLKIVVRNESGFLRQIQPGEVPGPDETDDGDGWKRLDYQTSPGEADQLVDLLPGIFEWNPGERLSVSQVLAHPWV
jgi:serine/threonine protein kinase